MTEEIPLDAPCVVVRADKAVPCIIVQLCAFASREQFKHLMNTGLAHYKAHNKSTQHWGWTADTRNMSAISQEVQQWLASDWNQPAHGAGWREKSSVNLANVLGRIATQQYTQQVVAWTESYVLEPVYYDLLDDAKVGVTQRCNAFNPKAI